mmetsp:Transcript_17881/g.30082  ORF Transcript_17881/g.30082 Transcript_17881/m.30082 type:complete len:119 (+) Transcript_17881:161-517(+)
MPPKIRIQAHVLTFTLLCGGASIASYYLSEVYGVSEEQKRAILLQKYPERVRKSEEQRKQMQEFFDQMKGSNDNLDTKFTGVLKGGKGDMKRWHEMKSTTDSAHTSNEAVVKDGKSST